MAVAGDDLGAPLLRTKLVIPGSPRLVVRESLIGAICEGLSRPLTLVYGPAGSGKTMLVAQWAASAREERRVAWLSLEADDNDPARFWMYVIEALRSVVPGFGEASLAMLRAPGVNLVAEALPVLINELVDASEQFVLVLDDYHAIEQGGIHAAMASLIEHLPATLRIVMTSRAEPPLRIGTLRARAQLKEIDAVQLRFSLSEAELMLNDVHGLGLTGDTVARLYDRTEGWAAGLYLAVLSMRGRDDASSFVASFTGSDRRVVDYLAAEVLREQGELEVDFLLATSVLDRFCAALCDAVTGAAPDSRAMLDRIERANYFLIPLDPRHEWYRYHHLFGELLRHELERRQPGRATDLHRLAGRWFLEAGMVSEAIGHLTAAGELDAGAELIDAHWLAFTNAGQRQTVARWMDQLPRGYIVNDGRLCLVQARTALAVGERSEVLSWVDLATQAPRNNPSDDAELGEEVTVVRAAAWQLFGDMRRAEQLARRLAPLDGSSVWHSLAACVLGTSARFFNANDDAQKLFDTALELGGSSNFIVSLLALGRLALIAADRSDWRGCSAKIEAAFAVVCANGLEEYWICTSAHVARGRLFRHDRRPTEARAELERAVGLARRGAGLVEWSYALTTLAELLRELGDRRAARELVLEARELLSRSPEPGTLVPRLLDQAEGALRLVVDVSGGRAVVTDGLTAREQTVLSLLPTGLSAREIGGELGISRDTVKTHTKRIYQKLGVSSRRDAVARGRDLGLL